MQWRTIIVVLAVAAVAVSVIAGSGGDKKKTASGPDVGKAPAGALRIGFAYSPEKEELLLPLVRRFNSGGTKVGGKAVFVEPQNVSSGDAETKIAKGTLKVDAWTPSSSLWGRLLNYEADKPYVARDNPSLVRTPLVIAMWEPLARALGWPKKHIGFSDVLHLALSPQGWGEYGHPEYGKFKLGHTNPDFSTSGLSAVAAEYYAATGKREGLTVADIGKPEVRRKIRAIEQSIVHYGDTTLFFSDQLKRYGPAYASAVAMEEATLIAFNKDGRGTKLVGLYPREGTFFSDNPYIALSAPWVSRDKREAAQKFGSFLTKEIDAKRAAAAGFRPGDPATRASSPVDAAHGADASEPKTVLSLPEPAVLARLKSAWRADRKAANVMLVVDTSGSMGEEGKIEQAKDGLKVFFRGLSPRDRVGLIAFNSQIIPQAPIAPFATNKSRLKQRVAGLIPDGETAVYTAIAYAVDKVRDLRDTTRINAVVALTDGQDTSSHVSAGDLAEGLRRQAQSEGQNVRVFTIAYGVSANAPVLEQIANASGGKEFQGDPDEIEAVYRSISSFF